MSAEQQAREARAASRADSLWNRQELPHAWQTCFDDHLKGATEERAAMQHEIREVEQDRKREEHAADCARNGRNRAVWERDALAEKVRLLRETLASIARCVSYVDGDCPSIAAKALREAGEEA